jgi:flagella basal body P-ring formation protein FlgA
VLVLMLASAIGRAGEMPKDWSVAIHLPRQIEIDGSVPTLGQVSVVRGEDSCVKKAERIALGRLVVPGQSVTISRSVLLGRLASNGIPASRVKLTGAEELVIRQRGRAINVSGFVELAKAYLAKHPPASSVCESEVVRPPTELIFKGTPKDVKLSPRLIANGVPGLARVEIEVTADGAKVGTRQVTFRLKYKGRRYVTLVDVPVGALITSDNVKAEETILSQPASLSPTPYGLVAKRRLTANTVIKPNLVGPAEPPLVFKRNQSVVIRIDTFGLLVTAAGKALEDGRVGQFVKVQNIDSGRTIVAKVNNDGTVAPVF